MLEQGSDYLERRLQDLAAVDIVSSTGMCACLRILRLVRWTTFDQREMITSLLSYRLSWIATAGVMSPKQGCAATLEVAAIRA